MEQPTHITTTTAFRLVVLAITATIQGKMDAIFGSDNMAESLANYPRIKLIPGPLRNGQTTILLSLPSELRNKILSMLLAEDHPISAFRSLRIESIPRASLDPRIATAVGFADRATHFTSGDGSLGITYRRPEPRNYST